MLLSEHQFGYRKKLSTSSAINALQNSILSAFKENKYIGGLFCDLHKAFDTINHKILLATLHYYGISSSPYKLIESYLADGYQRVEITKNLNKKSELFLGTYPTRGTTRICPRSSFISHIYI